MANFLKLLNELLNDNETNENIEASLNFSYKSQAEYFLSEIHTNTDFMLALVDKSIDSQNMTVRETELRNRSKLMYKYMIRDCFQYYLHLLIEIIKLCKKRNLPVSKIDTVVEILQRENVITPLVRSHWFSATKTGNTEQEVIQGRIQSIKNCLDFLSKMEVEEEDPNAM